jgi:Core binding factor beta subunit.
MFSLLQVHLKSSFIMNGVCVRWRGWLDLERLDGVGCLEYDEEKAMVSRNWGTQQSSDLSLWDIYFICL